MTDPAPPKPNLDIGWDIAMRITYDVWVAVVRQRFLELVEVLYQDGLLNQAMRQKLVDDISRPDYFPPYPGPEERNDSESLRP